MKRSHFSKIHTIDTPNKVSVFILTPDSLLATDIAVSYVISWSISPRYDGIWLVEIRPPVNNPKYVSAGLKNMSKVDCAPDIFL